MKESTKGDEESKKIRNRKKWRYERRTNMRRKDENEERQRKG